ncbi:hypothetical protein ABIA96_002312 [Bradyrhizobium sp. LB11.1]
MLQVFFRGPTEVEELRGVAMSGWRFIGLFACCVLLSALVVVIAAAFATLPHWI